MYRLHYQDLYVHREYIYDVYTYQLIGHLQLDTMYQGVVTYTHRLPQKFE